jgi:hypothetical protein
MPSYTKTEAFGELEWRRCKGTSQSDVVALQYFMQNYGMIQHPEKGAILIPLRPAQKEILDTWVTERYSIVLKARQVGWSTLAALYSLWLCFFWPDRVVVMLSKGEREAVKLLKKSTYAYDRFPPWLKQRGPKRITFNVKDITFSNDSAIESLPSKEDPARGTAVTLVIVDEWAFLDDPENAWSSIEPITDVGGRCIGLSTANGWGDFFHTTWVKARAGISPFKPMFYSWRANSDRDDDWYDSKKANMPDWQLHQEYPQDEDEAFIKSGNPFFNLETLLRFETRKGRMGYLHTHEYGLKKPLFAERGDGELEVWQEPEPGHGYVVGADVAEGLEYGDYSSAHVIDIETFEVVAHWHGHIEPDLFAQRLMELAYWYHMALVGCEVNNQGLTTNKEMQRCSYPRIYYRRELDARTRKQSQKIGWFTSRQSKPLMVGELDKALREELQVHDERTIFELRTYVRDEKGGTSGSPFDDRVISLAVANQMRQYANVFTPKEVQDDTWTWNWWQKRANGDPKQTLRIGTHNRRSRV